MTDHVRIAVPDVILPKENSGNEADSVIREETAGILSVIRIDSKNQNLSDGGFRAAHDQRLAAGSRQGPKGP